jgi:hypothetical protein
MLKINRQLHSFALLETPTLTDSSITERYDLQEFIVNSPAAFFKEIGEELFLVGKELLPSKNVQDRIDLLAIDKEGATVVIELKRGNHKLHMMQAISYAGMISTWASDELLSLLDDEKQESLTEFLECDTDDINRQQRLILIAEAYDYALLVGAEWLSEQYGVSISCCRISMAKDATTDSEYLVCSNVYPAPELAAEATSRVRLGKANRKVKWTDWETALANISNQAVVDFFKEQLDANRESYLRRRVVHYRVDGKRRWWVAARQKNVYVWQQGRFENDVEYWKQRLTNQDSVKPVKNEKCLRMFLENKKDIEVFNRAATNELQSAKWTDGVADSEMDEIDD